MGKFRPVSLASCLFKILEKLIYNRLSWYVECNSLLSPTQYGFRKGKSCADNLAILSTEIWTGLANNEITAGLFLDLKGAFPSVVPSILIQDLKEIGLPWQTCRFIYSSIACKNIHFKVNGTTISPRTQTLGLPQGIILSPINFAIYTRNLYSVITKGYIIIEFADDIVISCRSADIEYILVSLQTCLNNLSTYLSERGLDICPEKTQLVFFTNKRKFRNDPQNTIF